MKQEGSTEPEEKPSSWRLGQLVYCQDGNAGR